MLAAVVAAAGSLALLGRVGASISSPPAGFRAADRQENAIVFRWRQRHPPGLTESTVGTADQETQAAWQVSDIHAEGELHARGIEVEDYDTPGLKTEDGIADIGFAWAAWIIDPATNVLGILQIKE